MDGRTVIYQMATDFSVNEIVTVTLTPLVGSASSLASYQYQFVIGGHLPDADIIAALGDNLPYQGKENASDGDPANKTLIASVPDWTLPREWGKFSQQQSAGISLTAGQQYYVEAMEIGGGGGDNLAVGWLKPGQVTTAPSEVIPGTVLSPWIGSQSAAALKSASPKGAGLTPKFALMPTGCPCPVTSSGHYYRPREPCS